MKHLLGLAVTLLAAFAFPGGESEVHLEDPGRWTNDENIRFDPSIKKPLDFYLRHKPVLRRVNGTDDDEVEWIPSGNGVDQEDKVTSFPVGTSAGRSTVGVQYDFAGRDVPSPAFALLWQPDPQLALLSPAYMYFDVEFVIYAIDSPGFSSVRGMDMAEVIVHSTGSGQIESKLQFIFLNGKPVPVEHYLPVLAQRRVLSAQGWENGSIAYFPETGECVWNLRKSGTEPWHDTSPTYAIVTLTASDGIGTIEKASVLNSREFNAWKLDAMLNDDYRSAMRSPQLDENAKNQIRDSQRTWLQYRDESIKACTGDTKSTLALKMLTKLTAERVDQLREMGFYDSVIPQLAWCGVR